MARIQEDRVVPLHEAADLVRETMRDIIRAGEKVVEARCQNCSAEAFLVRQAADVLFDEIHDLYLDPQDDADLLEAAKDAIREP